ncbi:Glutamate-ammonia-ligase adenylyltransferase, partial [Bifidobacterium magnum]
MQQTQGYALSVRDAIRAGLRDTAGARKVCDELAEAGVDADRVRLLVSSLAHAADPDTALRNYVFIGRDLAMQGVALRDLVPGEEAMARLVAVLGSSDALGKLMRFRPRLVAAAATDPDGYAAMDRAARIAA